MCLHEPLSNNCSNSGNTELGKVFLKKYELELLGKSMVEFKWELWSLESKSPLMCFNNIEHKPHRILCLNIWIFALNFPLLEIDPVLITKKDLLVTSTGRWPKRFHVQFSVLLSLEVWAVTGNQWFHPWPWLTVFPCFLLILHGTARSVI